MVPLRVGATDVLNQADQSGIRYVLVHHGPKDGIENGTYVRAHHRVEAPQLIELARRLGANQKMLVTCVAFAFREGIPTDSALVFDARCLDNPYWVEDLRDLDGRDPRVAQFVLSQREATVLLDSLEAMLGELLPAYRARGRMELTLAFGCNGGGCRAHGWRGAPAPVAAGRPRSRADEAAARRRPASRCASRRSLVEQSRGLQRPAAPPRSRNRRPPPRLLGG